MEKRYKKEVEKFGKKILTIRVSQDMSQLDLELTSGINRTEISRIENGLKNIEFMTIVRLAESLKVQIVDLFS